LPVLAPHLRFPKTLSEALNCCSFNGTLIFPGENERL
jgi:hypothetical protein